MIGIVRSLDNELPEPDATVIEASLRALAGERLDLAPLILGCLDGEGLHSEAMNTVFTAPFHALDYATNALMDLRGGERIAAHAAYAFQHAGAGAYALRRWIAASGDGELPLVTAVGTRLQATLIDPAIELLGACKPPNDHALYQFISRNAGQLDPTQRLSVIRLVIHPVRKPQGLTDVLGVVAIRHFPEAIELRYMWQRWISSGCFDGSPHAPLLLARHFSLEDRERIEVWKEVHEALRQHVRSLVRSGDKENIYSAVAHLRANADKETPVLPLLLQEMTSETAEWDKWRERDPVTADAMARYMSEHTFQASGDRDWLAALRSCEQ